MDNPAENQITPKAPGLPWAVWGFCGLLAAFLVALELLLRARAPGDLGLQHVVVLTDDIGRCTLCFLASWAWFRRARPEDAFRPTRRTVAFALLVYGLAILHLVITLDWLQLPPAITSLRHGGYVLAILLMALAIARLPNPRERTHDRVNAFLDGLLIAAALFVIAWGCFLRALVLRHQVSGFPYVLTLVYPVLAISLCALWIFQESRRKFSRLGGAGLFLRAGLLLFATFQMLYAILSITGGARVMGPGERLDMLFALTIAAFGLGAVMPGPSGKGGPGVESSRPRLAFLPFLPPFVALLYALGFLLLGRRMDAPMVLMFTLLGVGLCLRQYLATADLERVSCELERANNQLFALNETKNRVIAVAAHDLRTPLTTLLLECELVMEEEALPEVRDHVGRITTSALAMRDLIQRLLDLHAIEAGQAEKAACEPMDLAIAAKEALLRIQTRARSKVIAMVDHTQPPAPILADPKLLGQILDNYLGNALKYSPSGRRVELSLRSEAKGWTLRIQDEGPGLTADDLEKVFRPYARLSAKPTAGEASVGLGLFLVKRMAEAMGGTVGVENNTPARGATFWVRLPRG
jgi:signal transduction histidine kinase